MMFFPQDFRSTVIPAISIIVSLIGTFAFMAIAGFSVNLLTLFALVLVIGTVVDDAIVVVEAVRARFDIGYKSPYMATYDAVGGVAAAIVTSTIVFMAVFIPVAMMGGTSGVFYTQFGITMAVAVGISAINSLTLSPALCAIMLKPHDGHTEGKKKSFGARFRAAYDTGFNIMTAKYVRGVLHFIRHKPLVWGLTVISVAALVVLM